ncbi:MAG: ABC transporter permease subunit [Spirochaetes bacterium]|jgi:ABC-type sugar transport system permease subunit|nr:ABC transporter permease subunit [Spirochaetota bacterium]
MVLDWTNRLSNRSFALLLVLPSVIFLLLVILYPAINLVWTSVHTYDAMLIPQFTGIENFVGVFSHQLFWADLARTAIYTVGSVIVFFTVGFAVALSLHKINRFHTFFRGVSLLPWAIPPVTAAMMWRWSLNGQFGIVNDLLVRLHIVQEPVNWLTSPVLAMLVLILTDAWIRIPFVALLLLAGLKSISEEIYESAEMDGAKPIQQFRYLTVPLLRYPISIVLALQTMFAFRTFDIVAVLTGGGPGNSSELLVKYVHDAAFKMYSFGTASAVSLIMLLICFLVVLFYWKLLRLEV